MQGLLAAEKGEGMVELDVFNRGSGFREGQLIAPEAVTPGGGSYDQKELPRLRPSGPRSLASESQPSLSRQSTILSNSVSDARASQELKSFLGNANSKLKHGATVSPSQNLDKDQRTERISLEQAKADARVEVDIMLESNACVQGSYLKGLVKIRVRKRSKHETRRVLIAEGKVRVIGFECIPHVDDRHSFYQCAEPLSAISPDWDIPYDSDLDEEGFAFAKEGVHVLPFAMHLPIDGPFGNAKGVLNVNSGVSVRYIAMVSIKVKEFETGKRSIAHFYRDCEIWPRLDPTAVLASAPRPVQCTTSKSLFMGGSGNAKLTALLSRLYWVAGQRCYVRAIVENDTKKTIKSLSLALVRRITVFRPSPELDTGARGDPDACRTATIYREVAGTTLEMAQRAAKGHASTKGWWTGVSPGERLEFSHCISLPPEALSVIRGRLLEVEYSIRVSISAGTLAADVSVDLPIRIINFISIDIPASFPSTSNGYSSHQRSLSTNFDSIDDPRPAQLRSKSDIGSLTRDKNLGCGYMDRKSISFDGLEVTPDTEYRGDADSEAETHSELGNLNNAHNSDEEIDFVVGTAKIDQGENEVNFSSNSDPYFDTWNGTATMDATNANFTVGRDSATRMRSKTMSGASYLNGPQLNSFATRVQQKMTNSERPVDTTLRYNPEPLDADTATPRPQPGSGWPRPMHTYVTTSSTIGDRYDSSPSSCSVSTLSERSVTSEGGSEQSRYSHSESSHAPGCDVSMQWKMGETSGKKELKNHAEDLAQSASVVNGGGIGKGKSADNKMSEVKKRIEAFEQKMKNSV